MYCDSAVGTARAISLPGLLQSGVIPIWPEMSGYPMVQAFKAFALFSFSPQQTEVIESIYQAIPNFDQVPGPTRRR
jgi:hypothetical protein